jgi:hypothetical protein
MKYLERKQSCSNSLGQALERQCVPMDLAAKEADFKGSLLDRVASLEHRLFQVFFVELFGIRIKNKFAFMHQFHSTYIKYSQHIYNRSCSNRLNWKNTT